VAESDLIAIPIDEDGVRGFLHEPKESLGRGMVLTHSAGSNCSSPLLVKVAEAFRGAGVAVLRCDLPFRQRRRRGPPSPRDAEGDREGLKAAVLLLRGRVTGGVILAGHSYGGRQASMLAADEPELAERLLLLSYPLHPPGKPDQLRVQHFPRLRTPALFVHGTADPFGSIAELRQAIAAIPAPTQLTAVEGAGHDLGGKRFDADHIVAVALS
jgi:predicted alpha/beta-hydrolase family hydrolase